MPVPGVLEILIVLLGVGLLVVLLKKMFKHPHGLSIALIVGICGLVLMAVAYRIPPQIVPPPPPSSATEEVALNQRLEESLRARHTSTQPLIPLDFSAAPAAAGSRPVVEKESPNEPAASESENPSNQKSSGKAASAVTVLRALGKTLTKLAGDNPKAETAANLAVQTLPAEPLRPAWVDAPAKTVDGVYQMAVAIGPYESRLECDRNLPDNVRQAVDQYVGELLGPKAVGRITVPSDFLRTHLVKEQWEEKKEITVTSREKVPMTLLHVLVAFDKDAKRFLSDAWHQVVVQERLRHLVFVAGYVLLLLTTFWGYLKLDLATQGAYRKRLRVVTALAVVVLAILAGTWG